VTTSESTCVANSSLACSPATSPTDERLPPALRRRRPTAERRPKRRTSCAPFGGYGVLTRTRLLDHSRASRTSRCLSGDRGRGCAPAMHGTEKRGWPAAAVCASRRKQQRERRGAPARRVSSHMERVSRCCVSTYRDSMVVSVSGAVAEVGSLEKATRWSRCSPRSHTFEIARFSEVAARPAVQRSQPRLSPLMLRA
jgi:hypothetical protein